MSRSNIEKAVDECYEAALQGGEAALEACLSKYPEFKDEIVEFVELAFECSQLPVDAKPSPQFWRRTRERLMRIARGEGPEDVDKDAQRP